MKIIKKRRKRQALKTALLVLVILMTTTNCDNEIDVGPPTPPDIDQNQNVIGTELKHITLDQFKRESSTKNIFNKISTALDISKNLSHKGRGSNHKITVLTDKIMEVKKGNWTTYTFRVESQETKLPDFENLLIHKYVDNSFALAIVSYQYNSSKSDFPYDIAYQKITLNDLNNSKDLKNVFSKWVKGIEIDDCIDVSYLPCSGSGDADGHDAQEGYCNGSLTVLDISNCLWATGDNFISLLDLGFEEETDYRDQIDIIGNGGSSAPDTGAVIEPNLVMYLEVEPNTAAYDWLMDSNNNAEIDKIELFLQDKEFSPDAIEFGKAAIDAMSKESSSELNSFMLDLATLQDTKITFSELWNNFENIKDSHFNSETDKAIFSNYCAINLSHTLLNTGVTMDSYGGTTCWGCQSTENNNKHAIRAQELATWLKNTNIDGIGNVVTLTGENFNNYISGKKGIVFFKDYWQRESDSGINRSGDHIDLWDGNELASSSFFMTWFRLTFPDITESIANTSSLYKSKTVLFWEIH